MLNKKETARFCSQLRMMLLAGMPLVEALAIIRDLTVIKKRKVQLDGLIGRVNEGVALSEATFNLLPPLAIGSIKAAERAGNLEEVLGQLAGYYEKKAELDEKIIGALIYPCFILCLSLISVFFLMVFVLPGFKGLFSDLGVELPLFTSLILEAGVFFSRTWFAAVLALIVGGFFLFRYKDIEKIIFRTPLLGKLAKQESTIQSLGTLGSLLQGGTPILEALTITGEASRSPTFRKNILMIRAEVENGGKLSEEFGKSDLFPREAGQMLKVGENSGQLAEMLLQVADFQAKEREGELKRFTTMLEPGMTLAVGVVVGFIALSIFMPMMDMISKLQ